MEPVELGVVSSLAVRSKGAVSSHVERVNPGLHPPGQVPRRGTAGRWARLCLTLHETAHLFSREAAPWLPFIWIRFTWPEAVHLFPRHVEASAPGRMHGRCAGPGGQDCSPMEILGPGWPKVPSGFPAVHAFTVAPSWRPPGGRLATTFV